MNPIPYQIVRSDRKTLSIQITLNGGVQVRAPRQMPEYEIERIVENKRPWIEKHLARISAQPPEPKLSMAEIHALADQAMEVLPRRAAHFAPIVGVTYHGITIRNQRSCWGSCSGKGNLNFNCLLMLCPPEVADYVVVHELCHLKQMNHSPAFWAEVERVLPDYKIPKQWLKEHSNTLIARMTG